MKKNILLALVAVVTMIFSGCSKEFELSGTKWEANYNNTFNYMDYPGTLNMNMTLTFKDVSNYSITATGEVTIMDQTQNMEEDTTEGTYTFDGVNGMFDDEQLFTYNEKNKTITTIIDLGDDPDDTAIFGANQITLVFKQVK